MSDYKDLFNTPEIHVIASFLAGDNLTYIDELEPSDFILTFNTFQDIQKQYKEDKSIDVVRTSKNGELSLEDITEILKGYEKKTFKSCYKKLIADKVKRKLTNISASENIEKDLAEITKIYDTTKAEEVEVPKNIFLEFVNMMDTRIENKDNKILTGLSKLDNITGGLKKREFITIAARPAVGKSAIALQMALNIAKTKNVLFISLEMSAASIGERIISMYSEIENSEFKSGHIKNKDMFWKSVSVAGDRIPTNLMILDRTFNFESINYSAKKYKPDVVIIDYCNIMGTYERFTGKRERLDSITRNLKMMANELDVLVIGLAQLNRNAQNKKPTMADIKDSGGFEENSDIVILLRKLYEQGECSEYKAFDGKWCYYDDTGVDPIVMQVEKHRNGATADIPLAYKGSKFTFREV